MDEAPKVRILAIGRGESARMRGPGSARWRSPSLRAGLSACAGDDPFSREVAVVPVAQALDHRLTEFIPFCQHT